MNISRYLSNVELKFTVEFVTPCFLGGADGNAEVRVAPFKNLIRRWWRIVNGNLSPEELWQKEAELFGSTEKDTANEKKTFGKSRVQIKIDEQESHYFYQKNKQLRFPDMTIKHPEVERPMGFETYLGMGPVFWNKELRRSEYKFLPIEEFKTAVEKATTEQSGFVRMILSVPASEKENFIKVLSYINLFGTIGSRSRNGWGSLFVSLDSDCGNLLQVKDIKNDSVSWLDLINMKCEKKYPSAIAKDDSGLLCWRAPQRKTWQEAMFDAANIYCQLRTSFKFTDNDSHKLNPRHLLGYPVTHHECMEWPVKNTRLPSELTIKIGLFQGKYCAQIMHIPNLIPLNGFSVDKQKEIWESVHSFLDKITVKNDKGEEKNLSRFGGSK